MSSLHDAVNESEFYGFNIQTGDKHAHTMCANTQNRAYAHCFFFLLQFLSIFLVGSSKSNVRPLPITKFNYHNKCSASMKIVCQETIAIIIYIFFRFSQIWPFILFQLSKIDLFFLLCRVGLVSKSILIVFRFMWVYLVDLMTITLH